MTDRGTPLTVFAILFGILAVSNLLKGLQIGEQTGFVLLGQRLGGTANWIAGGVFGVYLAVYAGAIWRMKRLALPLGCFYAAYVVVNLVLFSLRNPMPPGVGYLAFSIVYSVVAIGISGGAAVLLARRRAELR